MTPGPPAGCNTARSQAQQQQHEGPSQQQQATAAASDDRVGELFHKASKRAAALARTFEPGSAAAGIAAHAAGAARGELLLQGLGGTEELELPLLSKFLLVAGGRSMPQQRARPRVYSNPFLRTHNLDLTEQSSRAPAPPRAPLFLPLCSLPGVPQQAERRQAAV